MTTIHVLDSALEHAHRWIDEMREQLELPLEEAPRALHALRAGLHAIRDRLPSAEVVELGAQLPVLIRGIYYDGWRFGNDPTTIRDRAQMIARVERELAPDPRLDPLAVLRGVISLLVGHVSAGEIQDVVSTLPKPIASLWRELTPLAVETLAPTSDGGRKQVRHTGYTR